MKSKRRCLLRCDFSSTVGFGHVIRCLALAKKLAVCFDWDVSFAVFSNDVGYQVFDGAGFELFVKEAGVSEEEWLSGLLSEGRFDCLILDIRTSLSAEYLSCQIGSSHTLVVIDDGSDRRLAADLVFYPPVPQVAELDWSGYRGKLFYGPEWVIIRSEYSCSDTERVVKQQNANLNILITMGGSDPRGFTLDALYAVEKLSGDSEVNVVLGPGFRHQAEVDEFLQHSSGTYKFHRNVSDLTALMRQADFALAAFGVTAYELASMGVPAVLFCLTEDHRLSASYLENNGIAFVVENDAPAESALNDYLLQLCEQPSLRMNMSEKAREAFDYMGAERMAKEITQECISRSKNMGR